MRSFFIVVLSPLVGEDPYLAQRIEQVGIEHLLTIASVETLDQAEHGWEASRKRRRGLLLAGEVGTHVERAAVR